MPREKPWTRARSRTTTPRTSKAQPGFRSGLERALATQLDKAGVGFGYETVALTYTRPETYTPDFVLWRPDGRVILVEAKGYWAPEDRLRFGRAVKANPGKDIRVVFGQPRNAFATISKSSKTTMAVWLDKLGVPWAIKEIPHEWLVESPGPHPGGDMAGHEGEQGDPGEG